MEKLRYFPRIPNIFKILSLIEIIPFITRLILLYRLAFGDHITEEHTRVLYSFLLKSLCLKNNEQTRKDAFKERCLKVAF